MSRDRDFFFEKEVCAHNDAKMVIIPVPFEMTTSYQKGTKHGPREILLASRFIEDYDIETKSVPRLNEIFTLEPLKFENCNTDKAIEKIKNTVKSEIAGGRFPIVLGGEHSISAGGFKGIRSVIPDTGVVQLDAHADLRNSYEGDRLSHACVMRRIREITKATLSVGIRSYCEDEAKYIDQEKPDIIFADEFINEEKAISNFAAVLETLPENIFITVDVDVFDPSILPHTGTPEPGGLNWYQITSILKSLFCKKTVVGVDVVEFMPRNGSEASNFLVSKLVYKLITYYSKYGREKFSNLVG